MVYKLLLYSQKVITRFLAVLTSLLFEEKQWFCTLVSFA